MTDAAYAAWLSPTHHRRPSGPPSSGPSTYSSSWKNYGQRSGVATTSSTNGPPMPEIRDLIDDWRAGRP